MSSSIAGAVFLLLIGIGFLASAVYAWFRRHDSDQTPGAVSMTVDALVGTVALADAAMSVVDQPARLLLWSVGSITLVVAVALLVWHHRHSPLRTRR